MALDDPEKDITDLAEIAEEESGTERSLLPALRRAPLSIDQLAMEDPERAIAVIKARALGLETVRQLAFHATQPEDWVLFRGKDGNVLAMLTKSGAEKMRGVLGIVVVPAPVKNAHGRVIGREDVFITSEPAEDGKRMKLTASITGDAMSAVTGEMVYGIRGVRSTTEDFIGRGPFSPDLLKQDLAQAARTALLTIATRILGKASKVPLHELVTIGNWGLTASEVEKRCAKGRGYGKSSERAAEMPQDKPVERAAAKPNEPAPNSIISRELHAKLLGSAIRRAEQVGADVETILRYALERAENYVATDESAERAAERLVFGKLRQVVEHVNSYDPAKQDLARESGASDTRGGDAS